MKKCETDPFSAVALSVQSTQYNRGHHAGWYRFTDTRRGVMIKLPVSIHHKVSQPTLYEFVYITLKTHNILIYKKKTVICS